MSIWNGLLRQVRRRGRGWPRESGKGDRVMYMEEVGEAYEVVKSKVYVLDVSVG